MYAPIISLFVFRENTIRALGTIICLMEEDLQIQCYMFSAHRISFKYCICNSHQPRNSFRLLKCIYMTHFITCNYVQVRFNFVRSL